MTNETAGSPENTDRRTKMPPRRRVVRAGVCVGLAIALIAVVSVLTGGKVTSGTLGTKAALVGHHLEKFALAGLNGGHDDVHFGAIEPKQLATAIASLETKHAE